MPTYWNGGPESVDPKRFFPEWLDGEEDAVVKAAQDKVADEVKRHHPLTSPHRDLIKGNKIKRPVMFCRRDEKTGDVIEQWDDWQRGSVILALPGVMYAVVPPGGSINVDPTVSEKTVKANAPHLLNEEEYRAQQEKHKRTEPDKPAKAKHEQKPSA